MVNLVQQNKNSVKCIAGYFFFPSFVILMYMTQGDHNMLLFLKKYFLICFTAADNFIQIFCPNFSFTRTILSKCFVCYSSMIYLNQTILSEYFACYSTLIWFTRTILSEYFVCIQAWWVFHWQFYPNSLEAIQAPHVSLGQFYLRS